jgi:hypothetical protein
LESFPDTKIDSNQLLKVSDVITRGRDEGYILFNKDNKVLKPRGVMTTVHGIDAVHIKIVKISHQLLHRRLSIIDLLLMVISR